MAGMYRALTKDGREVKGWATKGVTKFQRETYSWVKSIYDYKEHYYIEYVEKIENEHNPLYPNYIKHRLEVLPETIAMKTGQTDSTKWEELIEDEQTEWLSGGDCRTTESRKDRIKEWKGRKIYGSFDLEGFGMTKGGDRVINIWEGDKKIHDVVFKNGSINQCLLSSDNFKIIGKQYEEKGIK
jgi:hypothetical protein